MTAMTPSKSVFGTYRMSSGFYYCNWHIDVHISFVFSYVIRSPKLEMIQINIKILRGTSVFS